MKPLFLFCALALAGPPALASPIERFDTETETVVKVTPEEHERIVDADLADVLMQAASEQVFDEDGDPVGFRLFEIDKGSPYDLAGLRDGDVVTHVNDVALQTPELAVQMLRAVQSEESFTYTLRRPWAHCAYGQQRYGRSPCPSPMRYSKLRFRVVIQT